MAKGRRRWRWAAGAVAAVLALVGIPRAYDHLRPLPEATAGDAEAGERAFLDSDLGSKNYSGIPRAVFEALPELFPEHFPEGWRGLGLLFRPDDPDGPPVGTARVQVLGVESYATNCALCHVGRFRDQIVVGAPNFDFDVQRVTYTLQETLLHEKTTVDAVAESSARKGRPLTFTERLAIRSWLYVARKNLSKKEKGWFHDDLGPGRSDALNGWKKTLGLPADGHLTWVDVPPVFNQKLKTKTLLDGSITGDPAVRIMLTELQKGRPFRDPLLKREVFDDIAAYMGERLSPPAYPFPIDRGLAERGRVVFQASCSGCHGTYGPGPRTYPNKRIAAAKVGTDPARAAAMTDDVKAALERFEYKKFLAIDAQPTYMPPPLDGVWMTAPYLHNGSVPTLHHLLHDPAKRPITFVRRWNDFDPVHVGFVCEAEGAYERAVECGPDAEQRKHDPRTLWTFDTRKVGNLNGGHTFGHDRSEEEKTALLEYLKTL